MADFENRAKEITATLVELLRLRGADVEHRVVASARPTLRHTDHDNWNGGTDLYMLVLDVPVSVLAQIEDRQAEVESAILDRVQKLLRTEVGVAVTKVVISPSLAVAGESSPAREEGDIQPSPWNGPGLRLFLSHTSNVKENTFQLREALRPLGFAGFVAHADIEPTREWQRELETALHTMDALVAVITPEFITSRWCDQEVGVAIGRKKLVIPVRVGADPHGFMGKFQGLQAQGLMPGVVADRIFTILARHPQSSGQLAEALVSKLEKCRSFDEARASAGLMERLQQIPRELLPRLGAALDVNGQLNDAWGVPGRLRQLIAQNSGAGTP